MRKLDSAGKANGTAQFTIDIREPNMLTVVVARPPRFGGKIVSFEAGDALAVRGVVDVKELPSGVAVYAEGMWPALKGREKLRVTWDEASAEKRSTDQLVEEYQELSSKPGLLAGSHGNAEAALARADRVIEAEFVFPYLAHAPMEPLDGFLRWDGERALARLGSQLQTGDHQTIAGVLDLKPEQVQVETMLAGGSFGRRAQTNMHLAAELAHAAKAIGPGRPVKLVWTREDDIRGGYYRPLFLHRMRGAVRDGKIVAWANTAVGQSFLKGSMFEAMIKNGIDPVMVEGARELPYEIADFRCEVHVAEVGVPTLWWRSQGDLTRPHQPVVVRGKDGHGAPGMACTTCHGGANFDPARVPGDPHWHLAPASMAWEGKSLGQICQQLKDPKRNGNRDVAAILKHVMTDSLVKWAWDPGPGRTPAPGTNAEFGGLLDAWAATGAYCPAP